jgi:hypothetical protein
MAGKHFEPANARTAFHGLTFNNSRFEWEVAG